MHIEGLASHVIKKKIFKPEKKYKGMKNIKVLVLTYCEMIHI
jgi:hypothetical protein